MTTTSVAPPPANKTIVGYFYKPHIMEGTAKVITPNWDACRQLCFSNPFCEHFGYWPNGGCLQQGSNVTLVDAKTECEATNVTLANCTGLEVISGPRDLSDESLWASVDLAKLEATSLQKATEAPEPATPAPETIDDSNAPATPDPSVTQSSDDIALRKRDGEESGSGGVGWFVGLLALLAIAGCAYAAYSMGLFGDVDGGDYSEHDDEDPEDKDGDGSPQE